VTLFPHELRAEQRLYWRSRELAFFTFLFPLLLFVLLDSVYGDNVIKGEGVKASSYLLAGMLGYGLASTAFAGLAIVLVLRRESGVLKRVRATPLSPGNYLAAVITSTVFVFAVEAAALLLLGHVVFAIDLRTNWFSLVLALLLGALSFAAMGIALAGWIRSAEGASAVVNAIYLPMAFLSGAFVSPHEYPRFLEVIAEVLPLTYFIRLMRDIVLRDQAIWSSWESAVVVAAWGLGALALIAARGFRWAPREG
jgi:ABC-2 type transport system permease protein